MFGSRGEDAYLFIPETVATALMYGCISVEEMMRKETYLILEWACKGNCHLHFAENDIIRKSISKQKSWSREGDLKYWRLVKEAGPSISPPDKTYVERSEAVCPK